MILLLLTAVVYAKSQHNNDYSAKKIESLRALCTVQTREESGSGIKKVRRDVM